MQSIIVKFLSLFAGDGKTWVTWESHPEPAAAKKGTDLKKVTTAKVEGGKEYKALPENAGTETGPLKWGEWFLYPFVISHNGRFYGRFYTVDGTVSSTYYVDGREVGWEEFAENLTPSKRKPKRSKGGILTIPLENIHDLR